MNTDTCVAEVSAQPGPAKRDVRTVALSAIPWDIPWALVNEFEAAAVLHQSVKVLRRQRHEGVGPRFLKLNGCTVRYKIADLRSFLDAQPVSGGAVPAGSPRRGPGRPRKVAA